MKSEIVMKEEDQKERTYPWLGISKKGKNVVVLFITFGEGVVVSTGTNDIYRIGYFTDTWDVENFYEFKGQVILSND